MQRLRYRCLLPYFPLEKINNDTLSVLVSMNDAVEGSALRLAAAVAKATWRRPRHTFVVHGEETAALVFTEQLRAGCGWTVTVTVPEPGQSVTL